MNGWNLVSETLPPLNVPCFLYEPDRGMWIGGRGEVEHGVWLWGNSYATVWHRGPDGGWDGDIECNDDYQPTHWIPLPSPPNASACNIQGEGGYCAHKWKYNETETRRRCEKCGRLETDLFNNQVTDRAERNSVDCEVKEKTK